MIVAPSMLASNFGNLQSEIDMVNSSVAGLFHLDIMDGVFVPNISYGFPIVKAISKLAKKPLDAHLMIVDPDRYIEQFAKLGVSYLSVHYEACTHLNRTLNLIKSLGMKSGVALNPHTPVNCLEYVLDYCDFVLIMSVNPGFGGQSFIHNSFEKIKELREMIERKRVNTMIEVDGGVNIDNYKELKEAGTDIIVAGSSVFSSKNPIQTIKQLSE
jgi:ribulose-phosphate 3-epimerase